MPLSTSLRHALRSPSISSGRSLVVFVGESAGTSEAEYMQDYNKVSKSCPFFAIYFLLGGLSSIAVHYGVLAYAFLEFDDALLTAVNTKLLPLSVCGSAQPKLMVEDVEDLDRVADTLNNIERKTQICPRILVTLDFMVICDAGQVVGALAGGILGDFFFPQIRQEVHKSVHAWPLDFCCFCFAHTLQARCLSDLLLCFEHRRRCHFNFNIRQHDGDIAQETSSVRNVPAVFCLRRNYVIGSPHWYQHAAVECVPVFQHFEFESSGICIVVHPGVTAMVVEQRQKGGCVRNSAGHDCRHRLPVAQCPQRRRTTAPSARNPESNGQTLEEAQNACLHRVLHFGHHERIPLCRTKMERYLHRVRKVARVQIREDHRLAFINAVHHTNLLLFWSEIRPAVSLRVVWNGVRDHDIHLRINNTGDGLQFVRDGVQPVRQRDVALVRGGNVSHVHEGVGDRELLQFVSAGPHDAGGHAAGLGVHAGQKSYAHWHVHHVAFRNSSAACAQAQCQKGFAEHQAGNWLRLKY